MFLVLYNSVFLWELITNCFCLLNFLATDHLFNLKLSPSCVSFNILKYIRCFANFTFLKPVPQEPSDQLQYGRVQSCCLVVSLSHDPGDSLHYLFCWPPCSWSLYLSQLDGASFSSLLRKDVCEVIFWRLHISATVFIVKSHVTDGLVRYRILHGKSFFS